MRLAAWLYSALAGTAAAYGPANTAGRTHIKVFS